jgi:hypothetical protein
MERLHWTKVIMAVLILSFCISIVATAVSSLVHTKPANNSWESITLYAR